MALGTKVGDIFLDLNINKKGFQTQLGSIGKLATKAGATIAAAFSVKKIIDFGKAYYKVNDFNLKNEPSSIILDE